MILKKVHTNNNGDIIISMCDQSIRGTKLEEGGIVIDATSEFFSGTDISDKELNTNLEKANSINAIGKESVDFLIEKGYAKPDEVKHIKDIPFVFIVQM